MTSPNLETIVADARPETLVVSESPTALLEARWRGKVQRNQMLRMRNMALAPGLRGVARTYSRVPHARRLGDRMVGGGCCAAWASGSSVRSSSDRPAPTRSAENQPSLKEAIRDRALWKSCQ